MSEKSQELLWTVSCTVDNPALHCHHHSRPCQLYLHGNKAVLTREEAADCINEVNCSYITVQCFPSGKHQKR